MRIACLGIDGEVLRLARAARRAGHEVLLGGGVPAEPAGDFYDPADERAQFRWAKLLDAADDIVEIGGGIGNTERGDAFAALSEADRDDLLRRSWEWESLLDSTVDAAIVPAGDMSERRADQLRKLTQSGLPLLVALPPCEPIVALELEMIRADAGGPINAYVPGIGHPAFRQAASIANAESDSPIGRVMQLTFDRPCRSRESDGVLRWLVRDLEMIRRVCGSLKQVSASGPEEGSASLDNLTVAMRDDRGRVIRWSALPTHSDEPAILALIGESGRAVLKMPSDPSGWRIELDVAAEPSSSETASRISRSADKSGSQAASIELPSVSGTDDADDAIAELETSAKRRDSIPSWPDICRTMEAWDAVLYSLQRRRTIDLHGAMPTETGTFKGVMAAGGCLLLTLVLFAFVAVSVFEAVTLPRSSGDREALLESAKNRRDAEARGERTDTLDDNRWPLAFRLWPVYPLVLFLVLQFLIVVSKRPRVGNNGAASDERPASGKRYGATSADDRADMHSS